MKQIVCIAGPTASGKSARAIKIAKTCDGEIINADSMQVYQDLHILSARPAEDEMEGVPHHLYGHVDGAERYSTGHWVREVMPVIRDVQGRGKTPVLVGGTGLYFRALTVGLAEVPRPTDAAMASTQALLDEGVGILRAKALELDPVATARVLGDDPQRLFRIVSVALGTEKPLSAWQKETYPLLEPDSWQGTILLPDRERLYQKINRRFDQMIETGALEEVRRVADRGLSPNLPMMKAIGLPPLLAHLKGELCLDEALFQAKRDTRRFAKRQFTWFRGNSEGWICERI